MTLAKQALSTLDAYRLSASSYSNVKDKEQHIKSEKLLRAMVTCAPTPDGQEHIAHAILLCTCDDKRSQLAQHYFTGIIRPMMALGGKTPQITEHPSRISAELQRDINASLIEEAVRDRSALKNLTLRRDNFRCLISKTFDRDVRKMQPESAEGADVFGFTEAAHIIPFSLNKTPDTERTLNSVGVWEIITLFSGIELAELNGNDINRLENVITLSLDLHKVFGRLDLWLEPLEGQPNSYRFKKAHDYSAPIKDGTIITFTSTDPALPLPDPRYLGLHAACAKIAHMSEAAEVIDQYMRDMDDIKVLAEDGSSMGLFEHVLSLGLITAC